MDVAYQYLLFFMEDDEVRYGLYHCPCITANAKQELAKIKQDYSSGKLLTGEVGVPVSEDLERSRLITRAAESHLHQVSPRIRRVIPGEESKGH